MDAHKTGSEAHGVFITSVLGPAPAERVPASAGLLIAHVRRMFEKLRRACLPWRWVGCIFMVVALVVSFGTAAQPVVSLRAVESLVQNRKLGVDLSAVDPVLIQTKLTALSQRLEDQQNQELGEYLAIILGLDRPPEDAYAFARAQSKRNLERIVDGLEPKGTSWEHRLAFRATRRSFGHFRHNTTDIPDYADEIPMWLSSRQLERLGLYPGLQGAHWFNRSFLRTQDWVFFFTDHTNDRVYGDRSIFVRGDYAAQRGFILPFVMGADELSGAGAMMDPVVARRFLALFESKYLATAQRLDENRQHFTRPLTEYERHATLLTMVRLDGLYMTEFVEKHADIFRSYRRSLADYMFTIEDHRFLVSAVVASHLGRLRRSHPSRYARAVAILLGGGTFGTEDLDTVIADAFQAARLPHRYEMRIPVGIPTEQLDFGKPTCDQILKRVLKRPGPTR